MIIQNDNKRYGRIFLQALILVAIIFIIAIIAGSCNKKVQETLTAVKDDSSFVKKLLEENRLLKSDLTEAFKKIDDLQQTKVNFSKIDSIIIERVINAGCNADSINKIINGLKSKVKQYADGSVEIEGLLDKYSFDKQRLLQENTIMKAMVDSLSRLNRTDSVSVTKEVISYRLDKKTKALLVIPWVLILIAVFITRRYGNRIPLLNQIKQL